LLDRVLRQLPLLSVMACRRLAVQRSTWALLLMCSILPGCSREAAPRDAADAGPRLRLLHAVTLHEDSAHFLARPVAMRVQPTGGAFILSDIGTNRVSVFSRTGEFQREFGQPGSGPGELEGPAAVFEVGDTLLAVYNMGHRSLLLFDSRSARFLRNIRLPGYPSSAQPLVRRDTAWLGARNPGTGRGIVAVDLATDSAAEMLPLPTEYARYPETARFSGTPIAGGDGDTLIVGWSPFEPIWIVDRQTGRIDTVAVPRRARRGTVRASLEAAGGGLEDIVERVSAIGGIGRLHGGEIVLVHFDKRVPAPAIRRIVSEVFVSVLDLRRGQACVDARVPATGDALPVVALAGDSLFVLSQTVADSSVTTRIAAYAIETSDCRWEPARHGAPFLE